MVPNSHLVRCLDEDMGYLNSPPTLHHSKQLQQQGYYAFLCKIFGQMKQGNGFHQLLLHHVFLLCVIVLWLQRHPCLHGCLHHQLLPFMPPHPLFFILLLFVNTRFGAIFSSMTFTVNDQIFITLNHDFIVIFGQNLFQCLVHSMSQNITLFGLRWLFLTMASSLFFLNVVVNGFKQKTSRG